MHIHVITLGEGQSTPWAQHLMSTEITLDFLLL